MKDNNNPNKEKMMMITIKDVAVARGAAPMEETDGGFTWDGQALADVGLALIGGCQWCGATIPFTQAHPSRTGYWSCRDCITDASGYESVAEFEAHRLEQEEEAEWHRQQEAQAQEEWAARQEEEWERQREQEARRNEEWSERHRQQEVDHD